MIKTITLTDGINEIDISDGLEMSWVAYPFAHIGVKSGSILVSQTSDVAEGADGTASSDSYVRIDLTGDKLYMVGAKAVVEIHTSVTAASPFKKAVKGGDNGGSILFSIGLKSLLPPIEEVLISNAEIEMEE